MRLSSPAHWSSTACVSVYTIKTEGKIDGPFRHHKTNCHHKRFKVLRTRVHFGFAYSRHLRHLRHRRIIRSPFVILKYTIMPDLMSAIAGAETWLPYPKLVSVPIGS